MKLQKIKYAFIAFLLLPVSYLALAAPKELKTPGVLSIISYSEFTPISYGKGQGYEADLLRAIAKLWRVKIKFQPENVYQGLWYLPSRTYSNADISIGGMSISRDRIQQGATFSTPTIYFKQSLLVRNEDYQSGKIVSYDSFKGKHLKIGVVPGTTGEQFAVLRAKESGLASYQIVRYPSEQQLLPALQKKEIDAIGRGEIGNEFQAAKNKNFVTIAKRNFHEGFSFAVNSQNPNLLAELNQAITYLTDHGKITYADWQKNPHIFSERADLQKRNDL